MEIKLGQDEKYQTRDGRKVRILAVDGNQKSNGIYYPVIALLSDGRPYSFTKSGHIFWDGKESVDDIVEAPKKFRYERWVNVYPKYVNPSGYCSKERADESAGFDRVACVKVVIEGVEGEGL